MTPQLQQAIKLLQLSNIELASFVETELEQNPLLERDERDPDVPSAPEGTTGATEAMGEPPPEIRPAATENPVSLSGTSAGPEDSAGGNLQNEDIDSWDAAAGSEGQGETDYAGDSEAWNQRNGGSDSGSEFTAAERGAPQVTNLRDHLLAQLTLDITDPMDRLIGVHLIDLLDDSGYLTARLETVAEALRCDEALVEAALLRLQRFDPPGVFARNLSECLALQLKDRNRFDPAMQKLLDNLPLLAARDINALMRICGVDAEDLSEMVAEIKQLDPKPGLIFDGTTAQTVVPDILMRAQSGGGWIIELNPETLPRVLVNRRYLTRLNRPGRDKAEKEYLAERLQSANWLVKSLDQRANTILRVATEIVQQQGAFFQHGVRHLKPLILRDIAEAINMHESTVSRVTTNKFLASPLGTFELKYFFTSSIPAASGGDAHSAEAVRSRIKSLVDAEAGEADVLSDEGIVEILQKAGIDIARRTVAKYREALRIPSSVQRRREKAMQGLGQGLDGGTKGKRP